MASSSSSHQSPREEKRREETNKLVYSFFYFFFQVQDNPKAMIPQALSVPQSNPPPSILPFLTAFSVVILVFISIIIFSVVASFAIIIFIYVVCQYILGPSGLDGYRHDLEGGDAGQITRSGILISQHHHHEESSVWMEVLERRMAERKGVRGEAALEKMAAPVSYGSSETASKCMDCAICLEDFESGELCQIFPVCNHIFHNTCIQHWLDKNLTCPICRRSILSLSEKC